MRTKGMVLALVAAGAAMVSTGASFPLEWNETYRTDVPYEVELNPAKLGAKAFAVKADGQPLKVETFTGKMPGTVALRFTVPAGTRALSCETRPGAPKLCDSSKIENLFAGALDAANLGRWELGDGVKAEAIPGGIRFRGTNTSSGGRNAREKAQESAYSVTSK